MSKEITKWKRKCPKCNKMLYYKTHASYLISELKKCVCYSCRDIQSHPHSDIWKLHLSKVQTTEGIPYIYRKNKNNKIDFREKRICIYCKSEFECLKNNKSRKFCSAKCSNDSKMRFKLVSTTYNVRLNRRFENKNIV